MNAGYDLRGRGKKTRNLCCCVETPNCKRITKKIKNSEHLFKILLNYRRKDGHRWAKFRSLAGEFLAKTAIPRSSPLADHKELTDYQLSCIGPGFRLFEVGSVIGSDFSGKIEH